MELSTVERIRKGSQYTIKSSWFLITMSLLVIGVYIYKMIDISNTPLNELSGIHGHFSYWSEYLRQSIQSIGSISILVGITLIARHTKKFGKYSLIGNFLILVNGALTGLWFEMVVRGIMFTLYAIQIYKWNKRDSEGVSISRSDWKEWLISLTLIIVIVVGVATPLLVTDAYEVINMKAPIPDAFQGILNIVGVWLIARRKTEGQLALVISNCFALAMFFVVGQPVMAASTAAFLVVSFIAWFQWEAMYAESSQTTWLYIFKIKTHTYGWDYKTKGNNQEIKEGEKIVLAPKTKIWNDNLKKGKINKGKPNSKKTE